MFGIFYWVFGEEIVQGVGVDFFFKLVYVVELRFVDVEDVLQFDLFQVCIDVVFYEVEQV